MNYKELTYKEKQAFEATLTPAQRRKMRKLEQEFKEQNQPIHWASHTREEEVRKEAFKTLRISERIQELEAANAPRIHALREQFKEIQGQLNAALEEVSEARSAIQTEPWHIAGQDAEVKAINKIWHKTKEAQEIKFQKLVDSFEVTN